MMNIIHCSSEVVPFVKTGGLADVASALPCALSKLDVETSIFLPRYKAISRSFKLKRLNKTVSTTKLGRVDVYFIEHPAFFDREGLYGDGSNDYPDNLERFAFFNRAVLEFLKEQGHPVDVIHCHDWQTALAPVYLKEQFKDVPCFSKTKTILSIHNIAFQGTFGAEHFEKLGLDQTLFSIDVFEFFGQVNLLKAGIIYSDVLTTVSPQYAKEIQTKEFGCALEGVISSSHKNVRGILNGLDYDLWNPKTDKLLKHRFDEKNYAAKKRANKKWLQKKFKLAQSDESVVIGFVGRLAEQKGIDLIIDTLKQLPAGNWQFVMQGVGSERYEKQLQALADQHKSNIGLCLEFDERTAHEIYAGVDLFVMPSRFEPCGLAHMIAMRYGAVPVVYKTGGLADTVRAYGQYDCPDGFWFDTYTPDVFKSALLEAIDVFKDGQEFTQIQKAALTARFFWGEAAQKYKELYACLSD